MRKTEIVREPDGATGYRQFNSGQLKAGEVLLRIQVGCGAERLSPEQLVWLKSQTDAFLATLDARVQLTDEAMARRLAAETDRDAFSLLNANPIGIAFWMVQAWVAETRHLQERPAGPASAAALDEILKRLARWSRNLQLERVHGLSRSDRADWLQVAANARAQLALHRPRAKRLGLGEGRRPSPLLAKLRARLRERGSILAVGTRDLSVVDISNHELLGRHSEIMLVDPGPAGVAEIDCRLAEGTDVGVLALPGASEIIGPLQALCRRRNLPFAALVSDAVPDLDLALLMLEAGMG